MLNSNSSPAILIFSLILLFVTAVFPGACSAPEQKPLYSDLKIDHSMTVQKFSNSSPSSVATVSGNVKNMGDKTLEIVSIVVIFYDSNKNIIDKSSAISSNLEPGGNWHFTIQSQGPDAWKIVDYSLTSSSTP